MKKLRALTPADLDRSAVWLYEGDNDEVALVHATSLREIEVASLSRPLIARTQFTLGDGSHHVGYCSPCKGDDLFALQPVIVASGGPVFFSFDQPPSREFLTEQWKRLGVSAEDVFPVHFRCTVPVEGEFVIGRIDEDDLSGGAA